MTIKTDKVIVENGEDFTFVCRKVPFAISCSTDLPHGDVNLIDLDLVLKMKIPLRNIRVTRMSLLGHDVRAVGRIKQTVQCVHQGRVQGTVHLEAKVVRDLYSILNVDCLASARTYERLVGRKPPDPEDEGYDTIEEIPNLDGNDEVTEDDEEVEAEGSKEEKEPPDPDNPPDLKKVEDEYTKYGFKDFEDALENAPWSHACIPRETDTWRDDIAAADKGYPDTRYDHVSLAMLRQGLAKLGPTDQDQDNNGGNRFHAQFGVKSHSPHLFDRGAPQDIKKHVASSGHHPRQLRGPRSRRKATQDEEDEYTADELAIMHGYPPGPAGRSRRIVSFQK